MNCITKSAIYVMELTVMGCISCRNKRLDKLERCLCVVVFSTGQKVRGNSNSSPTEKGDSPHISVTLKLAPFHPSI